MNLTPLQRDIITHIHQHGHDIPANIGDSADAHRNSVTRAIRDLEERGLVENKGRGVYKLTEPGREAARDLIR